MMTSVFSFLRPLRDNPYCSLKHQDAQFAPLRVFHKFPGLISEPALWHNGYRDSVFFELHKEPGATLPLVKMNAPSIILITHQGNRIDSEMEVVDISH